MRFHVTQPDTMTDETVPLQSYVRARKRCVELLTEVERLRAALATCRELRSLDADEIDRLVAALKDTTP